MPENLYSVDFRNKTTNIPNEDIEYLRNLCHQYYKLSDEHAYKNRAYQCC